MAVQLADARARHRAAAAAVVRAEAAGLGGRIAPDLARLLEQEETTGRHAAGMARVAEKFAADYQARIALEDVHAGELEELNGTLEKSRGRLAAAAGAAEAALVELAQATHAYGQARSGATARLSELGFTGKRFDGSPHQSSAGPVVRVAGRVWPYVGIAELMARAVARAAEAVGERALREGMRRWAGVRGYEMDALLADVPEGERTVLREVPSARMTSIREAYQLPEPVLAEQGGYHRDVPKRRFRRAR